MPKVTRITPFASGTERKIRVAAYCRVSSASADQLNSYANQIDYFTKYSKKHENWELVEIFADEGKSGTKDTRPEFQRMIRACELGHIDLIITKSTSRFGRNTKDTLKYVRKLKALGIGVIFDEQGINTMSLGDEMLLSTFAAIAQEESVAISQNQRHSIVKRMQSGCYVDSNAPYGFRLENKQLVEYPPESRIVKRIFEDYLNGCSATEIARALMSEGIPTKYGNPKWKSTTITYLLSNERYVGDCLYQKTFRSATVPFKQSKNRNDEDQFYADNTHVGFIDRDTFAKVQALLAQRKERHLKTNTFNTYALTSHVHCAECGSSFRRRMVGGGISWACTKHVNDKNACDSHYYREERIYDAFASMVNKLRFGQNGILDGIEQNLLLAINAVKKSNGMARESSQKIAEINGKILMLEQLRSKGYLALDAYQQQVAELNRELATLKNERSAQLNNELERVYAEFKKTRRLIDEIAEPLQTFNEQLFSDIVEGVYISNKDEIRFNLKCGFTFTERL